MADQRLDAWERAPGESIKAYEAFCVYRDLGAGRSLSAAYRAKKKGGSGTGGGGTPTGQWTGWMAAHDWRRRAEEYDLWCERQDRREREAAHRKELESYRDRQKKLAQVSLTAATLLLQKGGERLKDLQPEDIAIKDLGDVLRAGAMLARTASEAEGMALSVGDLLLSYRGEEEEEE